MNTSLPETFTIQDDFEPVSYEQWRAVVDETLKGAPFERKLVRRTYDGLEIQPIYSRRDEAAEEDPLGFPGMPSFARGGNLLGSAQTGWDLRQEFSAPDPQANHASIQLGLAGGVTSLQLKLDRAASRGFDPDVKQAADVVGVDGIMVYGLSDLEQVLSEVNLDSVAVALDSGASFVPAAALLAGIWRKRGVAADKASGAFNADPLGTLARDGDLPLPAQQALAMLGGLAKWTAANYPHVSSVGVDTAAYHDAGATAAQDIALAAATGVEYLRAMTSAGLSIDEAAQQILFRFRLGTQHFQALSKLRAARQVWCRIVEACGGQVASQAMKIHARTADRVLTQYDPHVNLLRNTVAVFAAGLGGAEIITSVPFDSLNGLPDDFSRRVARNTLHVLQEESHLQRVIDPAGGSWYLDRLCVQLTEQAWKIFQQIEGQGGVLAALQKGWIQEQIDSVYQLRIKDIASRKVGITGVSEFPDITLGPVGHEPPDQETLRVAAEKRVAQTRGKDSTATQPVTEAKDAEDKVAACVEAVQSGVTIGQLAEALDFHVSTETVSALPKRTLAAPFEQLRAASDAWLAKHGHRPRVFLANLGPIAHHTARATWSKNFFEAGGFEVLTNAGFKDPAAAAAALRESGAKLAVICSSDKLYAELVPETAAKLREAGAEAVVLAGHPGENEQAWRKAGVDRFIFLKCNVLETLRELLREQGVLADGEPTS